MLTCCQLVATSSATTSISVILQVWSTAAFHVDHVKLCCKAGFLSLPFETQGLAHCLPMQELIVSFPGMPVVVLGIGRATIAALARSSRLRLGWPLLYVRLKSSLDGTVQRRCYQPCFICFTKHEDQVSRAQGNNAWCCSLACQSGLWQRLCNSYSTLCSRERLDSNVVTRYCLDAVRHQPERNDNV